ncbi:hypothetical protein D3C81_190830 [compost metagenome]
MNLTNTDVLKLMTRLPVLGSRYQLKLDILLLKRLEQIEARFFKASGRFINQLHDLYDCLKDLQGPLDVDPKACLSIPMVAHTHSSNNAYRLLEDIKTGQYHNPHHYFKKDGQSRYDSFLDWYSNPQSLKEFIEGMMTLLGLYCKANPLEEETGEPYVFDRKFIGSSDVLDNFFGSIWLKYIIMDLLQAVTVVLRQRIGG